MSSRDLLSTPPALASAALQPGHPECTRGRGGVRMAVGAWPWGRVPWGRAHGGPWEPGRSWRERCGVEGRGLTGHEGSRAKLSSGGGELCAV